MLLLRHGLDGPQAYAGSEPLREELGWWQARLGGQSAEWLCERLRGDNREALARRVTCGLTCNVPGNCCNRRRRPTAPRPTTCC
ncbi:hypothetical protein P4233_11195 [Pseudomonas aeruginosa]|nr:hypothetical protein [Pseudomonas aeruginosa]